MFLLIILLAKNKQPKKGKETRKNSSDINILRDHDSRTKHIAVTQAVQGMIWVCSTHRANQHNLLHSRNLG